MQVVSAGALALYNCGLYVEALKALRAVGAMKTSATFDTTLLGWT